MCNLPPSIAKGAHIGVCRASGGAAVAGAAALAWPRAGQGHRPGVRPGVLGTLKIFEAVLLKGALVKQIIAAVILVELAVRTAVVVVVVSTTTLIRPLDVQDWDMILFLSGAGRSVHQLPLNGGHGLVRCGAGAGRGGGGGGGCHASWRYPLSAKKINGCGRRSPAATVVLVTERPLP